MHNFENVLNLALVHNVGTACVSTIIVCGDVPPARRFGYIGGHDFEGLCLSIFGVSLRLNLAVT